MIGMSCASAREAVADFVAGRPGAADAALVQRHVASCADCRAEVELARALYAARPPVPAGLQERVIAGLRADRAGAVAPAADEVGARRPWWGLSAAAIAAVALGIGIVSDQARPGNDVAVPGYAYEVEEGIWSSDDGLVAGAPSLETLSDEALERLLDELTVGGAGGAA